MTKKIIRLLLLVALILLIPLFGNYFIEGWNWGMEDFIFAAAMLFAAGLGFELARTMIKNTLHRAIVILGIIMIFLFIWVELAIGIIGDETKYKTISRGAYSFQLPSDWTEAGPRDVAGCIWDGATNDGGDGHRMNGEIGVYQTSCFSIEAALGKKEVSEKNGYYIIAYYDKESGTTAEEELETKAVHQRVVNTFTVK